MRFLRADVGLGLMMLVMVSLARCAASRVGRRSGVSVVVMPAAASGSVSGSVLVRWSVYFLEGGGGQCLVMGGGQRSHSVGDWIQ